MTQIERVLSLFPGVRGYFVEAGAHDGVGDSNTKRLEELGWGGICVEPSSAFNGLKRSRRCSVDNRCLWRASGQVEFTEVAGDAIELSGIGQCLGDHWDRAAMPHSVVTKQAVTLPAILAEHGAPSIIEYLCLDTEGSELDILTAHDFGRYRFLFISVEHNGVAARREALRALMAQRGYRLDVTNPWEIEDWFLHKSMP